MPDRTPTPTLDALLAAHGGGPRFTPGVDAALALWDSGTVDVSSVPMEQVIHARLELSLPCPAPYLKLQPPTVPVYDVTGEDLRREMATATVPDALVSNVIIPFPPVAEPQRKPFWTRIKGAALGRLESP